VTVYAKATKSGYPQGNSTANFVVSPPTSYEQKSSQSTLSLSKYWIYIMAIFVLIVLNVVIVIIGKRKKDKKEPDKDEENGD
jgi:hypothetical protein